MVEFVVYSRFGCHLCEDLLQQLTQLQQTHDFSVLEVDIDNDAQLVEKYGTKVPVVAYQNDELCHYFLDQRAILQVLSSHR